MPQFLSLLLISICAIIAAAHAINFFWQTGLRRALAFAAFFVCIFLVFWASGLWQDAEKHSWGTLTPVFFLMIVVAGIAVWYGIKIWKHFHKSLDEDDEAKH